MILITLILFLTIFTIYMFLQRKPNWKKAPHWAEYTAQDPDGQWYWYKSLPSIQENNTWKCDSICMKGFKGFKNSDWKNSLMKKPNEK